LTQSIHHVPEKSIEFQNLQFVSPIKWLVAFIGNLKGLLTNIDGLPTNPNTNMLIVYVTEETPEKETINTMREAIRQACSQGGLLIIRYKETKQICLDSRKHD